MKNLAKVMFCLVAIAAMQTVSLGQIMYSITDNNRDVLLLDQQYYSFDLSTGAGTLLGTLTLNGQQIRREYEGLAAIGSVLYGVAEFDTELCNTGSDPITGLASDLRTFRPAGTTVIIGPSIGETCFVSGFTESAAAYNPTDGWIYAIASDDLLPASAPRSRLYRVSPSTGLATQIGSGATAAGIIKTTTSTGGDENPYLDGMAILGDGRIFATEARFNNFNGNANNGGLYRLFATGANAGRAQWISNLFGTDVNRDTGLANAGNTLYLLLEDARIYTITNLTPVTAGTFDNRAVPAVFSAGNPVGSNTLSTPGCLRLTVAGQPFCGDFEGADIPTLPLR
ncbi:MAG: hypothetical protein ACT4O9_13790 [Blastocatellia bacterium]